MKKQYSKPVLYFEDFTLMDAITAACQVTAQHADQYTCTWYNKDFGVNIYVETLGACEFYEVPHEVPQDVVFPS